MRPCLPSALTGPNFKELNLFPIKGRNIELSFSGDRISSDGGLLLLRELDRQLNLLLSAGNCIHDVLYLRTQWPKAKIIVRGDSHFASQDFMDWTCMIGNFSFIGIFFKTMKRYIIIFV